MIESPATIGRKPARRRQTFKTVKPGKAETGVETAVVAAALNSLLDAQIQAEASVAGSLTAQQTNLQNAGACLNDPINFSSAPNGLDEMAAGLSALFDSFQKLASDPANFGRRRAIVRSAQKVAAQFNQASSRLNGLENNLNTSIQQDVVRTNRDLADIGGLNWLIMEARISGGTSGALAERRAQCLETLSGCGGLAALQKGLNALAAQLITQVNTIYKAGCDLNGATGRDFFTGVCASDIGVNNAVTRDLAQLQAGGAAGAHGNNAVAQTLAMLGNRIVSDLGDQTFLQSYSQTVSKLDHTLSTVNYDLMGSLAVTQMLANERSLAHDVSPDDERADLQRYQQAHAVSAKMVTTLNEMTPVE
jgi:flagellar hook-associated protein FlgK